MGLDCELVVDEYRRIVRVPLLEPTFLITCVLLPSFCFLFVLAGYCEAGVRPVSSFIDAPSSLRDVFAASCRWNLRHLPRNARSCAHRLAIMFCTTVASITYSGSLRYRTALSGRVTVDWRMCGAPAIVSLLPGFGHVDERRPLPRQIRAVRAGAGFADEMLMILWSDGTCSRAAKMCAVVRPFYLLCRKTLPGFRTLLSFLLTGGGPGCATAIDGGRTAPAVFRHRRWDAGRLWTVGPAR